MTLSVRRVAPVSALVLALVAGLTLSTTPGDPVAGAAPPAAGAAPQAARGQVAQERPNVVLITTDDQALSDMAWMRRTRSVLGDGGVTFSRFTSPHPLCCPARAELMSGEYGHNNGVRSNSGDFGGFARFRERGWAEQNLGVWLRESQADYRTAMVGKFMNGYQQGQRVRGWTEWNPTLTGTYSYYGAEFWNDGDPRTWRRKHVADVVTGYVRGYVRRWSPGSRPFFIWASHVGPHTASGKGVPERYRVKGQHWVPPIPATRHAGFGRDARMPSLDKASFDEAQVADKPAYLRRPQGRLDVKAKKQEFRRRIASLQSVDQSVERIVAALRKAGELSDTVIMFTSDNGYLLGEHRLGGKNYGFSEDLQVPFLVRGPGYPRGVTRTATATTLDIPATVLSLAGATARAEESADLDGISLVPSITGTQTPPTTRLIQTGTSRVAWMERAGSPVPGWQSRGVRTSRYTYLEHWDGSRSLYDDRLDPEQVRSRIRPDGEVDAAYGAVAAELQRRFRALRDCAGATQCVRDFGPEPQPAP